MGLGLEKLSKAQNTCSQKSCVYYQWMNYANPEHPEAMADCLSRPPPYTVQLRSRLEGPTDWKAEGNL